MHFSGLVQHRSHGQKCGQYKSQRWHVGWVGWNSSLSVINITKDTGFKLGYIFVLQKVKFISLMSHTLEWSFCYEIFLAVWLEKKKLKTYSRLTNHFPFNNTPCLVNSFYTEQFLVRCFLLRKIQFLPENSLWHSLDFMSLTSNENEVLVSFMCNNPYVLIQRICRKSHPQGPVQWGPSWTSMNMSWGTGPCTERLG